MVPIAWPVIPPCVEMYYCSIDLLQFIYRHGGYVIKFWASAMDSVAIEAAGFASFEDLYNKIGDIKTVNDVAGVVAELHLRGCFCVFDAG